MSSIPEELKELYPFESHFIPLSDGNNLHYIDEGQGETILFLHGNPTWSFFYRDLIKLLRENFRCIALDHMGFGLSDKPQNYDYSMRQHIANAIKFAELMHFKKFHLVVHDFGALVGLWMATRWPERISSVTVLNSAVFLHPKLPWSVLLFKIPLLGTILNRGLNLFTKMYVETSMETDVDQIIKEGYLFPYRSWSDRVAVNEAAYELPWFADHSTADLYLELEKKLFILFSKKMCFFWGDQDFLYDTSLLKIWAKIYPNAKLKRYDGAGHYLFEKNPEVVRDVRNFLIASRDITKLI